MGNLGHDSDFKSQLASEICSISTRVVACAHRHYCISIKTPFIDWYRLLGVEDDAGIDVIRKRFLNLALNLHPDKNAHPKAEVAFKLVSEGYACLSDNVKREAFDLDRKRKFCPDCKTIPFRDLNSATKLNALNILGALNNHGCLQDMRERFKEEATVIESCLRANSAATKERTSLFSPADCFFNTRFQQMNKRETPIFNPSDYICHGYPHFRTRIQAKPQSFRYLRTGNTLKYEQGRGMYEYPVFEIRSESFVVKKTSGFVYSNLWQNAL